MLAFGAADFGLESSIVLPALPVIAQEYSASLISVSWLATGFLLASVVAVPLCGRLGDLFGRRRLLHAGLTASAVGSLICALADSIGVLIAGRIVPGGGAAVGPLAFGIVRHTLPRERVTRGIGILVGAAGAEAATRGRGAARRLPRRRAPCAAAADRTGVHREAPVHPGARVRAGGGGHLRGGRYRRAADRRPARDHGLWARVPGDEHRPAPGADGAREHRRRMDRRARRRRDRAAGR